ncbi:MAG: thioredoxin domain-containing protein [Bacteroidetes bacterium]|nr:thioredoxin domain-containing protein [Bacteroidota bacterium]
MPNDLIHETSPYLLQHANNPVHWKAWNKKSLQLAVEQNKPILISIGYAACHWCHVMEHECFEDVEVARIMNEHFICIKVDREERPDVDQVYMDAAYLINGNGGWPLNALALPDGRPFFAATYFPKENWIRLLNYFSGLYINEPDKLIDQGASLSKGIAQMEFSEWNNETVQFSKKNIEQLVEVLLRKCDPKFGGLKGNMKFPMPAVWDFLLAANYFNRDKNAVMQLNTSLSQMAQGGIFDQIGGGFSRYATDAKWHVPHFEKMLYDNGQMVSLYSHAAQYSKSNLNNWIVKNALEFIERELIGKDGCFFSSLDADSEGEEGKYYVWSYSQIEEVLKKDTGFYASMAGISHEGNWEHNKNIPDLNLSTEAIVWSDSAWINKIDLINKKLLTQRNARIPPGLDDKVLTSWNAIMCIGYINAYKSFGVTEYLSVAKRNIDFLLNNICTKSNSLFRNYKNAKATIHGFLDDYAFLISALIDYYQVSFEKKYLIKAYELMEYTDANFFDENSGMYFYTDTNYDELIVRKSEITDNVIPASNSVMAKNLLLISIFFQKDEYKRRAEQMVKNVWNQMIKSPEYFSNWAQVQLLLTFGINEIIILGDNWQQKLLEFNAGFFPANIYAGGEADVGLPLLADKKITSETLIYVCRNRVCQYPVNSFEAAKALLQS